MAVKIKRILFWAVVFVLLLFFILFGTVSLLLVFPPVQQLAVNKAASILSKQLETEVSVGSIHLRPFKTFALGDVLIRDHRADTMIYAGNLFINIGGFSNLNIKENEFYIKELKLKKAYINLYKQPGDEKMNLSRVFSKLSKGKEKPPKPDAEKKKGFPFDLKVDKIKLQQITFMMRDSTANSHEIIRAGSLKMDVKELNLPQSTVRLNTFEGKEVSVSVLIGDKLVEKEKTNTNPYMIDIGWNFSIDDLKLESSFFQLKNSKTREGIEPKNGEPLLDGRNLNFSDINLHLKNVRYDSLIYAEAENITMSSGSKLKLEELSGILSFTQEGMAAEDLKVKVNNTLLSGSFGVEIPILSLNKFVEEAYITGNIRKLNVTRADVQKLFPSIQKYVKHDVSFSGEVSGRISNLRVRRAQIDMGRDFHISGVFGIKGLPSFNTSILDLKITQLRTHSRFVNQFNDLFVLPEHLQDVGALSFKGEFIGSFQNFVANGRFDTEHGSVITDIKMMPTVDKKLQYIGNVSAVDLNLAKFANFDKLGKTNFNLHVEGEGFKFEDIKTTVVGEVTNIYFNNYNYENIEINGKLAEKVFDGKIRINDDCLILDFYGKLDMQDSLPYVDCKAHIENADLQNLGFTKDKLIISLDGYISFVGDDVENINGDLSLKNLVLTNNNSSIDIDDILVNFVSLDDGFKEYSIVSDPINGFIRGEFSPVVLPKEIPRFLSNYSNYIKNSDTTDVVPQDFEANFVIDQDFGLIRFFVGELESASKIKFKGSFDNMNEHLDVFVSTDSLIYKKIFFDSLNLRATTDLGQMNVYTNLNRLFINKTLDFSGINAFVNSTKDNVLTNLSIGKDIENRFYQGSEILHYPDSTVFNLLETDITLKNNKWITPRGARVVISKSGIKVRNMRLTSGNQMIALNTDPNDANRNILSFENLNVADIVSLFTDTVILKKAFLNGKVEVTNPFEDLKATTSLEIKDVEVMGLQFDKLYLNAEYDDLMSDLMAALVCEDDKYNFDVIGNYNLKADEYNAANFDLNLQTLPLDILNILLKDAIEINANARGNLKFLGSYQKPEIKGMVYFDKLATVKIPYIGASLSFTDSVWIDRSIIDLGSISVSDPFGNKGFLEGKIEHFYFQNIKLDISMLTERFNFMNTTIKDNDQFFGRVFGEGKVGIKGPVEALTISGDVKTQGVSTFSVPISAQKDVTEYDFIRFFNPKDTLNPYGELKQKTKVTGLNIDLRLDVTPDVLIELILSAENNDKISARGLGNIQIDMNTLGDFNMRGIYTIASGQYILTLQNVIKKPFVLKPGGTVTFNGDVQNAEMNVDAIYSLRVPLSSLDSATNGRNQRVDVDIDLKLRGTLDKSEVRFDIVPSSTSNPQLQNYLNEIKQDENVLNTQVIGLLLFRRFLPVDNTVFNQIGTNFGSALGSNTALEFISIQMSQFLTKAIAEFLSQDIELNVNVSTSDLGQEDVPSQTGEVQLDFKYNVLGGRLLFNIGGDFGFGDLPQDIRGQNNNIAGDFLVEYAITEDGRFKIKAFHRTSQFDLLVNRNMSRTGVGISYQRDFDRAKELFAVSDKRKRKKERNKELKLYQKQLSEQYKDFDPGLD